ncbi:hypothetical protein FK530_19180 [Tsukamurella conjunctivitidis]|uniref:DUF7572 domain-containing protein n=1 Tax=Tsukamurella conjunctivitidis TaxID=2592068 RepID=A0A5C5RZ76_9ACTN|nr:hypothetical protein [Tsukamurella conjunctivitidis]TWS27271.1 hypothetical protein FK530_19180 [Tsukamurella conjunctivitidis]
MDFVHDLTNMCPVTKLYRADDGQHYAICCAQFYTATHTEVFLADEGGQIIDADGDLANGLTALVRWDEQMDHETAVARLTDWLAQ